MENPPSQGPSTGHATIHIITTIDLSRLPPSVGKAEACGQLITLIAVTLSLPLLIHPTLLPVGFKTRIGGAGLWPRVGRRWFLHPEVTFERSG